MKMEHKRDSRAKDRAKVYLEDHNVEKTISEMLNSLVHARDANPTIFMVTESLHVDNSFSLADQVLSQLGN